MMLAGTAWQPVRAEDTATQHRGGRDHGLCQQTQLLRASVGHLTALAV
jgi:hypothetical protein